MSQKVRLLDVFEGKRYHKVVLVVSVLAFLVLELLIYLAAASQAGQKSSVIVTDATGKKVYETSGGTLTSYEKLVFENTFGPLRNYQIQLQSETLPFPFRAWVSAAVGIPIGLVLLVSFLIKAYLSLLYGGEDREDVEEDAEGSSSVKNRFGGVFHSVNRISVFHVGFIVVIAVLLLWVVPNFLQDFATISMTAIRDYKWFFLGTAVFLALLITWIIYLRYKLSSKMLENQLDLEKFRVERQLLVQQESAPLLPNPMNEVQEPH
jgi:hypothetical protein